MKISTSQGITPGRQKLKQVSPSRLIIAPSKKTHKRSTHPESFSIFTGPASVLATSTNGSSCDLRSTSLLASVFHRDPTTFDPSPLGLMQVNPAVRVASSSFVFLGHTGFQHRMADIKAGAGNRYDTLDPDIMIY